MPGAMLRTQHSAVVGGAGDNRDRASKTSGKVTQSSGPAKTTRQKRRCCG